MATSSVSTVDTPVGRFTAITDSDGVVLASGFTDDGAELLSLVHPRLRPASAPRPLPDLGAVTKAVSEYFAGNHSAIDAVPVAQHTEGELFRDAWLALREIPAGFPVSYATLAHRAGRPTAVRAAAQACARNASTLFVPCHRVVRGDGSPGGYRWGTEVKRWLLTHESGKRRTGDL